MGKYDELTKYIPLIRDDSFGEWIFDKENDGSMEHPSHMPFVRYSSVIDALHEDIYKFCEAHPEYEHMRYKDTLEANGLAWGQKAMEEADVSDKDAKCVIALLMGMTRAERFCDGAMLAFLKKGCVLRWLERLKEIDEQTSPMQTVDFLCMIADVLELNEALSQEVSEFIEAGQPKTHEELVDLKFGARFKVQHGDIYQIDVNRAREFIKNCTDEELDRYIKCAEAIQKNVDRLHVVCTFRDDIIDMILTNNGIVDQGTLHRAFSDLAMQNDNLIHIRKLLEG